LGRSSIIIFLLLVLLGTAGSRAARADYCGSGKTVTFAGLNWESGALVTEAVKRILAKGYGCKVDIVPGNSVTLEQATANDDIQIFAEEWAGRSDVWIKAAAAGKVKSVGKTFIGATEGWFVPAYVVEGDPARGIKPSAPDLKSVEQLTDPRYVALFKDPEEPAKGRFLNCPSGWSCEQVVSAKLEGYGLAKTYVNFRPGTGAALDAAITSAILRGEPILFYYWSPTPIMGRFKLAKLAEPPFDPACWKELTDSQAKHTRACASIDQQVSYGVSTKFAEAAPELIEVLSKATFPLDALNAALAHMAVDHQEPADAAKDFLRARKEVWSAWVSPEAAIKIAKSLD
jgi:glycine betaine/proline transport system substrate-binding protein